MSATASLRRVPQQARSRARVGRLLDTADRLLAREGAPALTTTRVAAESSVSIGSLYQYFPDKEAIVEALALRYWGELQAIVEEIEMPAEPIGGVLEALAAGFRSRPGFLSLWYGGLRSERVRDATRPTRTAFARSIERLLAARWPDAEPARRATVARILVLMGDGLLREAFRLDPDGDRTVLEEGVVALRAYTAARLEG